MAEPVEDVVAVERSEEFAASPEVLWDAITDPDLLEEWFGPVDFDLTPGGAITTDELGEVRTIGVVETVAPPHRIGFVWIAPGSDTPSSVELEIDELGAADPGGDIAGDGESGGSILHVREIQIRPQWDARPRWFSSTPRARAGARA